jgi:hypothetical protein
MAADSVTVPAELLPAVGMARYVDVVFAAQLDDMAQPTPTLGVTPEVEQ